MNTVKPKSTDPVSSPLKWHGGKSYLAKEIVAMMPPRCRKPNAPEPDDKGYLHYVEPFAGGLSVLFENDPNGISEVVNDKYSWLAAFWATLANAEEFAKFNRAVEALPFASELYEQAVAHVKRGLPTQGTMAEDAAAFFICCRQSMSGRMKGFAPLTRNRTRRGMNEQASAWLNCVEGLPAVHQRLKRVVVLNDDAIKVIKQQDGPRTLFYLDPPYVHDTRSTTGEYEHEMTDDQHRELLDALAGIEGRFLLSGYRCGIYDQAAADNGWLCVEFDLPNNSASGKTKERKTECVWMNYVH